MQQLQRAAITEAILAFHKALKCHSCERCPSIDSCNAAFYNGPLLAAIDCGCMFCWDCYAVASNHERNTALASRCPICRTICKEAPRPLLLWLANENKALPTCGKFGYMERGSHEQLNSLLRIVSPLIDTVANCKSDEEPDSTADESEVPGTCLPFRSELQKLPIHHNGGSENQHVLENIQTESSQSFPQTEEVPGTCLSYNIKQRMTTHRNPQRDFQLNHYPEALNEQSEEVPASHVSFFERQRILNNGLDMSDVESTTAPCNELCNAHTEEVPGRICTKNSITSNQTVDPNGEFCGETEEVPGTLISSIGRQRTETGYSHQHQQQGNLGVPEPCNESWGDQSFNASSSQRIHSRNRSEPEPETEEVAGTYISFFDRQRASTSINESQTKCISSPLKVIEKVPLSISLVAKEGAEILGTPISRADMTFYLAIDTLDSAEADALELLNKQGRCAVVNGIHTNSNKRVPFPPLLVTHAMEKTAPSMPCLRSYQYLKAVALGAEVIDAKWLIVSKQAGVLLDYGPYIICKRPCPAEPRLLKELSFGIIDIRIAETNSSSLTYQQVSIRSKKME